MGRGRGGKGGGTFRKASLTRASLMSLLFQRFSIRSLLVAPWLRQAMVRSWVVRDWGGWWLAAGWRRPNGR